MYCDAAKKTSLKSPSPPKDNWGADHHNSPRAALPTSCDGDGLKLATMVPGLRSSLGGQ